MSLPRDFREQLINVFQWRMGSTLKLAHDFLVVVILTILHKTLYTMTKYYFNPLYYCKVKRLTYGSLNGSLANITL